MLALALLALAVLQLGAPRAHAADPAQSDPNQAIELPEPEGALLLAGVLSALALVRRWN